MMRPNSLSPLRGFAFACNVVSGGGGGGGGGGGVSSGIMVSMPLEVDVGEPLAAVPTPSPPPPLTVLGVAEGDGVLPCSDELLHEFDNVGDCELLLLLGSAGAGTSMN